MKPEVEAVFELLDQHLRPAALARVGPPSGLDDPLRSHLGGGALGLPGEGLPKDGLPQFEGRVMLPLLQINLDELPHTPAALDGLKLLALFVDPAAAPFGRFNVEPGQGWLVREYASLDGLAPLATDGVALLPACPVIWELAENEAPGWEDAWSLVDLSPVTAVSSSRRRLFNDYTNHPGTKVGGYPTEVRRGVGLPDYVFQVGNEAQAGWEWGDNGMGYFFRSPDGAWRFACQMD